MKIKSFTHTIVNDINVKFTIHQENIDNRTVFSARIVDVDLECYQKLKDYEKESFDGTYVTNGKSNGIVYYSDQAELEKDLKELYGKVWLESKIN